MPEQDPIEVRMTDRDGAIVLRPDGEIGYHESPTLRNKIKIAFDRSPRKVVVDLGGVDYMSTPGLATLVEALQVSKRTKIPLMLCGLNERVLAIFEIAKLQTVFNIVDTADEAVGG